MQSELNSSGDPGRLSPPPPQLQHNIPALVLGVLLIIFIICGNLLVCLSVCTEKALKTTTNYFIVSLAVADLLLAVLVLPLYVYSEFQGGVWTLSTGLCDALMTMDVMLCTASIFNLCAISVDRFIAVSVPLNYNRRHIDLRQIVLISTTWLFALAVASPVIFGINDVPRRRHTECKLEDDKYVVYSSVCSFFIPCPIMLLLYCGMFRGLRQWEESRKAKLKSSMAACRKPPPPIERGAQLEEGRPVHTVSFPQLKYAQPGSRRKRAKINGRERKAMRVLPVVVGAFLLCWTPFFVVHITRALCASCRISPRLVSIVTWLGYVNSALNPIIYTVFNAEFRNFFRKVLRCC
ncbi:D(4) dopamine receptor-like [Erpetoichthys calabaricus]|uniref:Dopamine receptor D4b n=1 Tax=Erpetoichthys calabaricus TaxID=27687 RepID=A0A8C4X321_ERPCA|nr:D(4) dopamine receptor-like [Erpetoichthys calabaricus]